MKKKIIIIGAGIVGLTTAYSLTKEDRYDLTILEKEDDVARHQTGRNSGVIHSGLYYPAGSEKAKLCVRGRKMLLEFCNEESVPYEITGKVVVATEAREHRALLTLLERGLSNGVNLKEIPIEVLKEYESHVQATKAVHVADAGIISYREVSKKLKEILNSRGVTFVPHTKFIGALSKGAEVIVRTERNSGSEGNSFAANFLVNCAGLHSDRVARLSGISPQVQIVPFRGEYYDLLDTAPKLVRNLIYPVPDDRFPFLGVHFTRMIEGGVECGPNAVLALGREAYAKTSLSPKDAFEIACFRGFHKIALRYWKTGLDEFLRSFSKKRFAASLQKMIPEIEPAHLTPGKSGIRAQAISRKGELVKDFVFQRGERSFHVLNAPSPAATASFAIGERIAGEVEGAV